MIERNTVMTEKAYIFNPNSKLKTSNNIKYLRNRAGMTQQELSRKSGVTQSKISIYEQTDDLSNVYFGTIIRIAQALGVTVDEIISPLSEYNTI